MFVDIHSLGVFSQLAKRGSERAAGSLSEMTGASVRVDVTNVSVLSRTDLSEALGEGEYVGVEIGFDGGMEGVTVLAFERGTAGRLLELLLGPGAASDAELARSGVEEVGNIVTSGFIDGWADHLGVPIDITPPTYVERSGERLLRAEAEDVADDEVFLFESRITATDRDLEFHIYMSPDYDVLADLTAPHRRRGDDAIPIDELSRFNETMRRGAESAASHVATMTGLETSVDVSRLSFVPIDDAPGCVGEGRHAGAVFGLDGLPSGYLLVLFDEPSAHNAAEAMLPAETAGSGLGEPERSAIEELGNVMTSGFIDGWANVLGTSIEHTPPQFVHDTGSSIMSSVVTRLGESQSHAFVIDSKVRTAGGQFGCDIYVLPNEAGFARALRALEAEGTARAGTDVDGLA